MSFFRDIVFPKAGEKGSGLLLGLFLGRVLLEKVLDSFFEEVVLPFVLLGCKYPEFSHEISLQSSIIAFSFLSHANYLAKNKPYFNKNSLTEHCYFGSCIVNYKSPTIGP